MDGPMAAVIVLRSEPNFIIIASRAFLTIPFTVPFHPVWTIPITFLTGSASNIGTQSAVKTPMARPPWFVIIASASVFERADRFFAGFSIASISFLWTWFTVRSPIGMIYWQLKNPQKTYQ